MNEAILSRNHVKVKGSGKASITWFWMRSKRVECRGTCL